ncbi:nucleoside diphosphate kinase 6-like [Tigriopus californicus]|uniref:nucleoside diphosphate kinase 6-like n=1 Tax=Tigriopus californicus TaxID=6832 RepID=UPI0027DA2E6D|nr:nucleoside diphosphate kinase 6-like [Tigriopus californicus]|eukprot:TCALIF_01268-PA protein Name:"Similar to nme6 Nucleoside diphosphate kinase 6 (Xenopus tropicalis)" AED:0.35 eAED:0.35 QI:0/-1/0/1/-1/1/1/0/175
MATSQLQLTLAIIKPDIAKMTLSVLQIRDMMLKHQFRIVRSKTVHLSPIQAGQFYQEHEGKFFYHRLVTFMSSGPSHVHILAKENAIQDWRALMGPTKVFKTRFEQPDTIRGRFGLTDTRNCSHGSDSDETAKREIGFFFPQFDVDYFMAMDEPKFRQGPLWLDPATFEHVPADL